MSSVLINPPSTLLGAEVERLLEQQPPVVRHHCERTFQFAAAFATADGVELDHEVLYLGTVLHDVGLSPGGDQARGFGCAARVQRPSSPISSVLCSIGGRATTLSANSLR